MILFIFFIGKLFEGRAFYHDIIRGCDIIFYCNSLSRGAVISGYYSDFDAGRLISLNSIRNL